MSVQSGSRVRERMGNPSVGLVILVVGILIAALLVAPTLQRFVEQRQRIAALEHTNQQLAEQASTLRTEQARWSDPAFIESQARGRLMFAKPGDTVYILEGDTSHPVAEKPAPATPEQHVTEHEWSRIAVRSLIGAGVGAPPPAPDPTPAANDDPAGAQP
mgnify:CR=1 FL=1